jgi:rhodanese-related sulfurtransferase
VAHNRRWLGEWLLLGFLALLLGAFNQHRFGPLQAPAFVTWSALRGQDFLLIDLRSSREFQTHHVAGALSLPVAEVEAARWPFWLTSEPRPVVVYAQPGNHHQAQASARLLSKIRGPGIRVLIDPPL